MFLSVKNEALLLTNEGSPAYDEAIAFMTSLMSLSALKWNDKLASAAAYHTTDIGPKGLITHNDSDGKKFDVRIQRYLTSYKLIGENIAFGSYNANAGKRVVLALLVDDGVLGRGHRANLFNAYYTDVGISTGVHNSDLKMMTTMDFARL